MPDESEIDGLDDFFASLGDGDLEKKSTPNGGRDTTNDIKRLLNPIDQLDSVLHRIQDRMNLLEQRIRENSISINCPPHLFDGFNVMRNNASNPYKNYHRNAAGLSEGQSKVAAMQPFQFSAALSSRTAWEEADGEACYHPRYNIVTFADDFEPESVFDLFIAYHEIQHVRQFHEMLSVIGESQYFQLAAEDGRNMLPHFEVEAWALQIEAMNLYLGNWLRQNCKEPITDKLVQEFLSLLNAKPERLGMARSLLEGSQKLFPQGIVNHQVPKSFSAPLAQSYGAGKQLWKFTKEKGVQRLDTSDSCDVIE